MVGAKREDRVEELAKKLAGLRKKKVMLADRIRGLDAQELEVAAELNSVMGIVPVEQAAKYVRGMMEKLKKFGRKKQGEMMRRRWENKTPEERELILSKLKAGRKCFKKAEAVPAGHGKGVGDGS